MTYDYVVVGGGVYGCATAWELARRGAHVVVLEARTIASGASGGPGKRGVRACGRDPRELPLMRLAYELWPALADEIGAATGYERMGGLHLFEREPDGLDGGWASAPARAWAQNQRGIATEILERDAVRALEPDVCDTVSGALFCPNDGIADHTATTRGLAEAATRLGAEIREGTAVAGLERADDRVTAVVTAAGERIAVGEAALLLTNTHAPGFVREALGVDSARLAHAAAGAADRAAGLDAGPPLDWPRAAHASDQTASRWAGDDLGRLARTLERPGGRGRGYPGAGRGQHGRGRRRLPRARRRSPGRE